ncbi:hypothetical protein FRC12_001062 [Ceratobasidium sp. 428]|nr:hypothetical protein FRC12_001062 [Ceratobasidium sp. 428]
MSAQGTLVAGVKNAVDTLSFGESGQCPLCARPLSDTDLIPKLNKDSGSIASLMGSIVVVEELMRRVQKAQNLPTLPRPNQHFKLIIGAGFTGLLAIMFGRLGLSIDEAKLHCSKFAKYAFSSRKWSGGNYKASRLEAAIKRMLVACGEMEDARMLDPQAGNTDVCRAVVCVASEHGMRAGIPVCLRTYPFERNSVPDCTIVEALRAAFALPGVFKPATILETGEIGVTYVGLVDYNPTALLLGELSWVFPDRHVSRIMSIGTTQVSSIATNREKTAQDMAIRFQNTSQIYFRFNPDHNVRSIETCDWRMQSVAVADARSYLSMNESGGRMSELASMLNTKSVMISTADVGGVIPARPTNSHIAVDLPSPSRLTTAPTGDIALARPTSSHTITSCPPSSGWFTGRIAELNQMEACLADGSEERRVFVLHGLGGAGKTQLALRFVELHKKKYQHIFYIDATSTTTIETDLRSIARDKKAGDDPSHALTWLAQQSEPWLVVYDNADDASVDLGRFFPSCPHGRILVTTRNHKMVVFARGTDSHLHVSEMLTEDALQLLATAVGNSGGGDETDDVDETSNADETSDVDETSDADETGCTDETGGVLVKELGYFALAIILAGAYIRNHPGCTTLDYLDMYRRGQGQILEEYDRQVPKIDKYELAVYATWRVSYERLDSLDRQLYNVMAFMHHEHISEDIFCLAASGLRQHKSALQPSGEKVPTKQTVSDLLAHFHSDDQQWNKAAFLRSIDGLQAYSLVTFDTANKSYSIHPLVHQWARTQVQDSESTQSCAALLLAACVTQDHKSEDYTFRRILLNHIDVLPEKEKTSPQLVGRIKIVYYEAGRYEEAETLAAKELQAKIQELGEEHLSTLTCKAWKASVCSKRGQWHEAEILQQEVLDVVRRVRGEEHPYTLTSMANMADIYRNQGRWEEADRLGRIAVDLSKRVLGTDHSNTTTRMGNLACTLWKQGKLQEAEALDREVIEIKKRLKGPEHPDTQTGIANLATTLWSQGRWEEAEGLHREVLELSKQARGSEHPYTLKCMHNLANARWSQKKWDEAEKLLQEAVEVSERVQGPEHPQTLKSKANLAEIYRHQKRWENAEVLERRVVEVRSQKLGNMHPDTLESLANLALTCRGLSRLAEAEELMASAVDGSKHTFGNSHKYTKNRVRWLAAIQNARTKPRRIST